MQQTDTPRVSSNVDLPACHACQPDQALAFEFSMAFQPIVDLRQRRVIAYEALARMPGHDCATALFKHITPQNSYQFDQQCRVKAVQLAAKLGLTCLLSINFMPNAIYRPELCIRTTLAVAKQHRFPEAQLMFEFTEQEQVHHPSHLKNILNHYRALGFKTAVDDFGAGYSTLNLVAEVPTDFLKLDMALVRHIDRSIEKQTIVRSVVALCIELQRLLIAEGVETAEELACLQTLGVYLFQGFYFAKPAYEQLPPVWLDGECMTQADALCMA